ncbi:MAG: hypothetical protein JST93_19580 [Acidobacteria bacterium]|nr:hypothetical protein [Acidobacteriota bacterium]
MKQMLLVFDEITFVDPVDDHQWRAKLFNDLEAHDGEFAAYKEVNRELPMLIEQGCIKRVTPSTGSGAFNLAANSALADLMDREWVEEASTPSRYSMPSIPYAGQSSWQAFKPKLPSRFLEALQRNREFHSHLLRKGDANLAWSLSYAAGSAIAISLHLELAEKLNLAPVTDSAMHHRLMLMKAGRTLGEDTSTSPLPDRVVRHLAIETASVLLSQTLSEEHLNRATFEQIIRFREETAALRRHFVDDLELRFGQLRAVPSAREWIVVARQVLSGIQAELRKYDAEFAAGRLKVWPGILRATTNTVAAGSLAAIGLALIPAPHALLAGGLTTLAAGAVAARFEWAAERARLEKSASPSVAYLSTVRKHWQ